jgi:F0F1-type ATP synthase epsilon subunit
MFSIDSVQVNLAAESGDMGVLANHVPSIEQLRPGIVEIIEESGGNNQFFRMWLRNKYQFTSVAIAEVGIWL